MSRTFQVVGEERFSGTHDGRYAGMAVEGATVVERVARVQQPPAAGIHGDGGVAAGVTGKCDEDDPGCDGVELLGGGEPLPRVPGRVVLDDLRVVRPLSRAVAHLLPPGRGPDRPGGFGGGDVDLGVGEIGQAAGVVKVEVGEDNVPDIGAAKAEPFDLAGRGLGWV